MDNHTKQTDPSVKYLVQMFPEEFLRNLAKKTGFIKRIRKIDPVIFFWVLTLGFGVDFLRSIRALERRYETEANIELSDGALYDRFTPELVAFLRECVLHAIEFASAPEHRSQVVRMSRSETDRRFASLFEIGEVARYETRNEDLSRPCVMNAAISISRTSTSAFSFTASLTVCCASLPVATRMFMVSHR